MSTGTADRTELKRLWPTVLQRYAALEAEWARKLTQKVLTKLEADGIAAHWERSNPTLNLAAVADELFSVSGLGDVQPERAARQRRQLVAHTEEAARLVGISLAPESAPLLQRAMWPVIAAAYLRASSGFDDETRRILDVLAPASAVSAPAKLAPVSLRRLYASYRQHCTVKQRTAAEIGYAVEGVITFLGHDDAARIERADLARWRDALKEAGRTNNTFNNRLSLLGQVLAWGVSEQLLSQNVATLSLRLNKNKPATRHPYTDEQAARILNAARRETKPSLRWGHWIMALSGARAGEVMQLMADDVRQESGIHYFTVHEDGEGRSVKNGERRNVPIHPALAAEGFLDYVRSVPLGEPLFPDQLCDRHGIRGARSWKMLRVWVRRVVGIIDIDLAPSHSWRHRMEDELRMAGVEESHRDALLGHARKTTGRLYGQRGESLIVLAERLARVRLPQGILISEPGGKGR